MKLVLATQNQDKIREIKASLQGTGVRIVTLDKLAGKLAETGKTLEENALQKAKRVYRLTGLPSLADDSGLEVKYLKGAPGVKSSRFTGPKATYRENCRKLLKKLEGVPTKDRAGRFRCILALVLDSKRYYLIEGKITGRIAHKMLGKGGFGYDPLFYLLQYGKTFAQLSLREKNKISHRGKALAKLKQLLLRLP